MLLTYGAMLLTYCEMFLCSGVMVERKSPQKAVVSASGLN